MLSNTRNSNVASSSYSLTWFQRQSQCICYCAMFWYRVHICKACCVQSCKLNTNLWYKSMYEDDWLTRTYLSSWVVDQFCIIKSSCLYFLHAERCVLPWPQRLFESESCVVELVEGSTTDFQVYEKTESNYTAMLHWYDSQGAHRKLDIRKAYVYLVSIEVVNH